jgi:hypothetical protein
MNTASNHESHVASLPGCPSGAHDADPDSRNVACRGSRPPCRQPPTPGRASHPGCAEARTETTVATRAGLQTTPLSAATRSVAQKTLPDAIRRNLQPFEAL